MRPPGTRCLRHCTLTLTLWALAAFAWAAEAVVVDAPAALRKLITTYIKPPDAGADRSALEAFARKTEASVRELLATEGYFSPEVTVRTDGGRVEIGVIPGRRTTIGNIDIQLRGELSAERREALRKAWPIKTGEPFRQEEWDVAKQTLLRRLLQEDFPEARLTESHAEIDPQTSQANLQVVYELGPAVVFGELKIMGLSRYSPDLILRYNKIKPGEPYDEGKLLALQTTLQNTPYFASVAVQLGTPVEGANGKMSAPVEVHVRERPPHRIAVGGGFSTNTGARAEINYRGSDFLRRAWQFEGGVRLEQLRQSIYADVFLPPGEDGHRYSVGALLLTETIQGLTTRRAALGGVRTQTVRDLETRYALTWQRESREPQDAPSTRNKALALSGSWTWRRVDDLLDPRRGYVLNLQSGGGTKALLSDQNFLRLYGRYQHFFPVGARDVLALRAELGTTLAPSRIGIPEDFLFRAGGSQSVRGYAYQSLGVREGNAIVGGRYMQTVSAEYTHWLTEKWGAAVFVDAGNAGDDRKALSPAVGYGAGARWKSPVGPLAVDLAYGQKEGKVRLHFSLAVAF